MDDCIGNRYDLLRFASLWYADATPENPYIVCAAYRRKYDTRDLATKPRPAMFKRMTITAPGDLLKAIKSYERLEPFYDLKTGVPYPKNTLVLFSTVNRSDRREATKSLVCKLIQTDFKGTAETLMMGELARIHENSRFIHLDIDCKEAYKRFDRFLHTNNIRAACHIETCNGFHVILARNTITKQMKHRLHEEIRTYGFVPGKGGKDPIISYTKGNLLPVPGTYQNNFIVRLTTPRSNIIVGTNVIVGNAIVGANAIVGKTYDDDNIVIGSSALVDEIG